jgi:3-deoxy-7-phosphoheptulonate synthase
MHFNTDDVRIDRLKPLIPPAILMEELPLSDDATTVITDARATAERILRGEDRRLLVVVGPCSIHHEQAALDYAGRLHELANQLAGRLFIIMRVYFEKPRTTVGWKGLINDPDIDGSFKINKGLRAARRILLGCNDMGLPTGCEFLDTITPQFIADCVSWGAIGARTTESQVHRELASGLSMPIGFKNGTDGNVQIAIDAIRAARDPHHFLSVTKQAVAAIVATKGNDACHLILRGSNQGPNYQPKDIDAAADRLRAAGCHERVMVDCSHGNSQKDHHQQPVVARAIGEYLRGGGDRVFGVMLESFIVGGRQDVKPGQSLVYGQSITDACMDWETTRGVLEQLAHAVG